MTASRPLLLAAALILFDARTLPPRLEAQAGGGSRPLTASARIDVPPWCGSDAMDIYFRFVEGTYSDSSIGARRPGAFDLAARSETDSLAAAVCGRLFVIAIGGEAAIVNPENDARLVATRLSYGLLSRIQVDSLRSARPGHEQAVLRRASTALRTLSDTASLLQLALLTGREATLKSVREAFEAVIRKSRATDTFVFCFIGSNDDDAARSLLLSGARETAIAEDMAGNELPNKQLRQWLDNIAAMRQLVILGGDGGGPEFVSDYISGLIENSIATAQLLHRERVFVAPHGRFSDFLWNQPDGATASGLLAHTVATAEHSVLELLFPTLVEFRLAAETELRTTSGDLAQEYGEFLRVFYERDFLDLYARVAQSSGQTRSGSGGSAADAIAAEKPAGRHTALLFATNRYHAASKWGPLSNPVHDARTIAHDLASKFGFDTTVLVDPTLAQIFDALLELKKRTYGPDDQLFIFFAGHGHYDEGMGMGYLVAQDSKPFSEDPYLNESYLPHAMLENMVAGIESRHMMLVLDACFGGTFRDAIGSGGTRGEEYEDVDVNTFITRKMQHRSRLYLTSGGKEYVPDGRPGAHSPFARRFLEALREASASNKVLTISQLRARVEGLRPEPKSGEFGDHEPGGDFLFIPAGIRQ